jgi:hypothetical protein
VDEQLFFPPPLILAEPLGFGRLMVDDEGVVDEEQRKRDGIVVVVVAIVSNTGFFGCTFLVFCAVFQFLENRTCVG